MMLGFSNEPSFLPVVGCLVARWIDDYAAQLPTSPFFSQNEREVLIENTRRSIIEELHKRLTRLLFLELNSGRLKGELIGETPQLRWKYYIQCASSFSYWCALEESYPGLLLRIDKLVGSRCLASLELSRRWLEDKKDLQREFGVSGDLTELKLGLGDFHIGGRSVSLLRFSAGALIYKPRSVAIDCCLADFLASLSHLLEESLEFRVPQTHQGVGYGWAEFISHQYSDGHAELESYYRGLGNCLAVMHLLGATDLHAENIIAARNVPVVIDCETMFSPRNLSSLRGFGLAANCAANMLANSVMSTGMLPLRSNTLSLAGIDYSAFGALPDQQPDVEQPIAVDMGTDRARLGFSQLTVAVASNQPCEKPVLDNYWRYSLKSFTNLTEGLRNLDKKGWIRNQLQEFYDCEVRVIKRPTEVYSGIGRMTWHPISLHNEQMAKSRARELLCRLDKNTSQISDDIDAEVDELMAGNIPECRVPVRGSDGHNLVDAAFNRWKNSDPKFDARVMATAMPTAYLRHGLATGSRRLLPKTVRFENLEQRRHHHLRKIVMGLLEHAIYGEDNTVTWIAPVPASRGWALQPIGADLYSGISGIAVLLAAYLREQEAGRVDALPQVRDLLKKIDNTLLISEKTISSFIATMGPKTRPPEIGAFVGIASQMWALLTIASLRALPQEPLIDRAICLADDLFRASELTSNNDVLAGKSGAIAVLLNLANFDVSGRAMNYAIRLGDQVITSAHFDADKAFWRDDNDWPDGIGGFSHGVTGVGWAISRLANVTGEERFAEVANAAFRYEETLYDNTRGNWIDLREGEQSEAGAFWCHGALGIGLAHLDLDPSQANKRTHSIVSRAYELVSARSLGWNHNLCHGDSGACEFLLNPNVHSKRHSRDTLLAHLLTSIEDYGVTTTFAGKDNFTPGLLVGSCGVAYQLLRMHSDCNLPSPLLLQCLNEQALHTRKKTSLSR